MTHLISPLFIYLHLLWNMWRTQHVLKFINCLYSNHYSQLSGDITWVQFVVKCDCSDLNSEFVSRPWLFSTVVPNCPLFIAVPNCPNTSYTLYTSYTWYTWYTAYTLYTLYTSYTSTIEWFFWIILKVYHVYLVYLIYLVYSIYPIPPYLMHFVFMEHDDYGDDLSSFQCALNMTKTLAAPAPAICHLGQWG